MTGKYWFDLYNNENNKTNVYTFPKYSRDPFRRLFLNLFPVRGVTQPKTKSEREDWSWVTRRCWWAVSILQRHIVFEFAPVNESYDGVLEARGSGQRSETQFWFQLVRNITLKKSSFQKNNCSRFTAKVSYGDECPDWCNWNKSILRSMLQCQS